MFFQAGLDPIVHNADRETRRKRLRFVVSHISRKNERDVGHP